MSFTSAGIDPGDSQSLNVAVDRISTVDFQRIKLVDPTEGSTTAIGIASNPLKVQDRRRGTADYDSGVVEIANGAPASITGATIYPEAGFIANNATSVAVVLLVDAADGFLQVHTVAAKTTIPLPTPEGAGGWAGLKAGASVEDVYIHVAGGQ